MYIYTHTQKNTHTRARKEKSDGGDNKPLTVINLELIGEQVALRTPGGLLAAAKRTIAARGGARIFAVISWNSHGSVPLIIPMQSASVSKKKHFFPLSN